MARRGLNKTEEIRKLLRHNPSLTGREIVDRMASMHMPITTGMAYKTKKEFTAHNPQPEEPEPESGPTLEPSTNGNGTVPVVVDGFVSFSTLRKVKELAHALGGKRALIALAELLG